MFSETMNLSRVAATLPVKGTCISEAVQDGWNRFGEVGCAWTNEQMLHFVEHYKSLKQQVLDMGKVYTEVQKTRQKVLEFWNCKLFLRLMISGLITVCLACTVAQPFVIIFPWMFAVVFSMGSLQIMAAFLSLMRWQKLLKRKPSKKGILLGGLYWLSVFSTLYSAIAWKSCLLCLCFAFLQVVSLFGYLVSCLSGGVKSIWSFFREVYHAYDLLQYHLSSFRFNEKMHEELHEE